MGKRKNKRDRHLRAEAEFDKELDDIRDGSGSSQLGVKHISKKLKKQKKRIQKHQVTITKEHRWYRVRDI